MGNVSKYSQLRPMQQEEQKLNRLTLYLRLFFEIRSIWHHLFIVFLLLLIETLITSKIPYFIGQGLSALQQKDQQHFKQYFTYFIVASFLKILFNAIRVLWNHIALAKLNLYLRQVYFNKIIYYDMVFFQQFKIGELMSRFGTDINTTRQMLSRKVFSVIKNCSYAIVSIYILFTINAVLAAIYLLSTPLFILLGYIYTQYGRTLSRIYRQHLSNMIGQSTLKFNAIIIIKAFTNQKQQIKYFNSQLSQLYHKGKAKIYASNIYVTISSALPLIVMALVMYVAIKFVKYNQLSVGQLTTFVIYLKYICKNCQSVSHKVTILISGLVSVQRVSQIYSYEPPSQKRIKKSKTQAKGQIIFNRVYFQYPLCFNSTLQDINITIKKGQYIGISGQSGCGKSTFSKLLMKLYQVNKGNIFISGVNINLYKPSQLHKYITIVSQQPFFFSGSIIENLTFGIDNASITDIRDAASISGALNFIQDLSLFPQGFESSVGQRGRFLSGGQRQRLAIARALLRRPEVLILDEATSALDGLTEQQFLCNLHGRVSMTIIQIGHRLSAIMGCDRIYVLQRGRIIQFGSHKQLISRQSRYKQLINSKQFQNNQ